MTNEAIVILRDQIENYPVSDLMKEWIEIAFKELISEGAFDKRAAYLYQLFKEKYYGKEQEILHGT